MVNINLFDELVYLVRYFLYGRNKLKICLKVHIIYNLYTHIDSNEILLKL